MERKVNEIMRLFQSRVIKPFQKTDGPFKQDNLKSEDPVVTGLKWILIIGQVIGVSPISLSLKPGHSKKLTFRWWSFSSIHSLSLTFVALLVFVPELWTGISNFGSYPTILDELNKIQRLLYSFTIVVIYIYWFRNAQWIIHFFHRWTTTMEKLNLRTRDTQFPRFCWKIVLFGLGPGVVEIMLYNAYLLQRDSSSSEDDDSLIGKIYKNNLGPLAAILPHHSNFLSSLLIYGIGIGYYCWYFVDVFLIVLCRAISHKFKEIGEEIKSTLCNCEEMKGTVNPNGNENENCQKSTVVEKFEEINVLANDDSTGDKNMKIKHNDKVETTEENWKEIRGKIWKLCDLADEVTSFVAPLLLVIYRFCIFVIILNILRFLYEPNTGTAPFIYVTTIKFPIRIMLVTYYASQVYHSPELVLKSMERYPDSVFPPSARRLERFLARHPIGVTIAGMVLITRKTLISILSFIFTIEIVLLQAMGATKVPKAIPN